MLWKYQDEMEEKMFKFFKLEIATFVEAIFSLVRSPLSTVFHSTNIKIETKKLYHVYMIFMFMFCCFFRFCFSFLISNFAWTNKMYSINLVKKFHSENIDDKVLSYFWLYLYFVAVIEHQFLYCIWPQKLSAITISLKNLNLKKHLQLHLDLDI